jgi:long-chain acyl-CoA synthetase
LPGRSDGLSDARPHTARARAVPDSALVQDIRETAPDPVRAAAVQRPGSPALIAGDTVLTWADLDARVDDAVRRLPDEPGSRVAIVLGNGIDFAVTYFAVLRAGLVAVPLNPGYTADELRHAITDSGATLVVAAEDVRSRLGELVVAVPPDGLGKARADAAAPAVAADALAVLLYTSGTGGRPKAAMLSHAALAANHDQLARIDPPVIGADDVVLLAMPFFHAYGLNTGLGAVAHHGARFTLIGRAYLYGLMAGGRPGVDRTIEILTGQIQRTMRLLGVTTLDELEPGHVTALKRLG